MTPQQALDLAAQLHAGQVDKAGRPYIEHLKRVQARLVDYVDHIQVASALHDSIEDQGQTAESLAAFGVPSEAIEIIDLVTKRKGPTVAEQIFKISRHPGALAVKLADTADNSDPLRLAVDANRKLTIF